MSRGAFPARDDGARVSHSSTRRRTRAGHERNHRLAHGADEHRGVLLHRAANLPHHDDCLRVGVRLETAQRRDEIGPGQRVTSDTDTCRLSDTLTGQLTDDFVCQGAAARNDADVSRRVNRSRHDTYLAAGRRGDEPRAVRAHYGDPHALDVPVPGYLVESRNEVGDAHHQGDAGIGCLDDGVRGVLGRNEDEACR